MKKSLIALIFLILALFAVPVFADDFQVGMDAANRGDFARAFEVWEPLAKRGNALAQFNLGLMYDKGEGVKRNYKMAVKWYKLAARQGISSAQFNLGWLYSKGKGVRQSFKRTVMWYIRAAKQGNSAAQFNLGLMYQKGLGVERDMSLAMG